jgi:PIN domain nuclease of toxin-antitoxin system
MRLLLDTHVLIWWLENSAKLPKQARTLIKQTADVYVSSASIWELIIKIGAGKLKMDMGLVLTEISRHQFKELPISFAHASQVLRLPALHRDPFDRMLVAQAISEPLTFLTADHLLAGYSHQVYVI